ncbi:MAG: hypothetical protein FWH20_04575 [Oscillospiraceae bacterium]|nr:hypothetical protein [Oscillospiraceae bacterium]
MTKAAAKELQIKFADTIKVEDYSITKKFLDDLAAKTAQDSARKMLEMFETSKGL